MLIDEDTITLQSFQQTSLPAFSNLKSVT
jgi:hypothetical protein